MNNLLEQKITIPSVLKFTFPSMIMMVIMSLYTVADGTFVSRLVGTRAFSAVNIIYPLVSFTIGLGTMFGAGTTAIVARKIGEGKREEANRSLTFIVLVTIALGIMISIVCFLFLNPIIYALGANEAVYADCRAYAFPLVFFFTANMLQCQFQNLYVANGKPHVGLIVTAAGGLANIVLDYVFLAVFDLGVGGAAAATGIGYAIPALHGLFYFTFCRGGTLRFERPNADVRTLLRAVTNGSSEMVSYLSTSVTTFLFNIIMMRLSGENGVAAISILLYLDFVLVSVSLGYSMGAAPLFSCSYGSGDHQKLKKLYKMSIGFFVVTGAAMTAGTLAFAGQLASIFAARGTAVYEMAVTGLGIYAVGYLFRGINVFSSAMFTAFGDGKVSAILSFLRTFVFLTASLLGLSALFGVDGVWRAAPLAELLALAVSVYYFASRRKQYHYLGKAG